MPISIESFSIESDFGGQVFATRLHNDLRRSINTNCIGVSINVPDEGQVQIEFEYTLSPTEKNQLGQIVTGHVNTWIEEEKRKLCRIVDKEIKKRIHRGFNHSNRQFSLSVNAQLKWSGLVVSKDMLPYPLRVPTISDEEFHDIQDANEVISMWQTAIRTVKTHIGTGTDTKENIKNAPDLNTATTLLVNYLNN